MRVTTDDSYFAIDRDPDLPREGHNFHLLGKVCPKKVTVEPTTTTVLSPFVRDYPGKPVPEG